MSDAQRYVFHLVDGSRIVGPVQGCGGVLAEPRGLRLLRTCLRREVLGQPLPIYEPLRGCVCVFPAYSAEGGGEPVRVDLRDVRNITAWKR